MQTAESLSILSIVSPEGRPGMCTVLLFDCCELFEPLDNCTGSFPFSLLDLLTNTRLSDMFRRIFGLVVAFCVGIKDFAIVLVGGEVDLGGGTVGAVLLFVPGGGDGPFRRAVVCRVCGTLPAD